MKRISLPPIENIGLVGGRLCLDFVNSANWLNSEACDERLNTICDLIVWGQRLGLIDGKGRRDLMAGMRKNPRRAARDLAAALSLRQNIWRLFAAEADGKHTARSDTLDKLNAALRRHAGCNLHRSRQGFALDTGAGLASWLVRPVAYSALELLTSPRLSRVRHCPGERCGWLFLDESPNGLRRWCSMATCGNRHKAQRHYAASRG